MINMDEYTHIGYTKKPHGLKGELKILIEDEWYDRIDNIEAYFIKIRGQLTPYFLEFIRGESGTIAKFEDINTREAALDIGSKELYVRTADLAPAIEVEVEDLVYAFCKGYEVIDTNEGHLGIIEEVLEYPQQEMAIIITDDNNEVLFPLNKILIKKIDETNEILLVDLPEGFLDLFKAN